MRARLIAVALIFATVACGQARTSASAVARPSLTTDSARYTVRFGRPYYRVRIGFVYRNGTSAPVSANYCRSPAPPMLEKWVDGRWVLAYAPAMLLCKSEPPFRVASGEEYRSVIDVAAAKPGLHFGPELAVASIPGIYRLRWILSTGPDPDDRTLGTVEAISASFELVER